MADSESIAASSQAGDDPLNDRTDEELQNMWEELSDRQFANENYSLHTVKGKDQDSGGELAAEGREGCFKGKLYSHGNEILQNETIMFEKYLKRVEPNITAGATTMAAPTPSQSTHDTRIMRKRSKSKGSGVDRHLKLTAEQKCDIAQREIEELRDEIEKLKEDSEKIIDTYKAGMEEADVRLSELKKSSYEFERDILKGAVNQRSGKVVAEKVIRFFEDKQRARDALIEKLRLKNSTLKVQKKKLHLQLKQKEEMGEVLHEVDFQQLKIENSQYLEKIDERNQDLLRLKLMAGNTLQVLNTYKKKLHTLTLESDRLKAEISSRNELLVKIDQETETVESERAKAEDANRRLRQQLDDFRVPEVVEYVKEKAELYELAKTVKSWERKVEIADMALKTHRKTWQQMKISSQQHQHQHQQQWPMEAV